MSDDYQIDIPASFISLYSDARGRLRIALQELRDRYELCEDLAQELVGHCRSIHVEIGVNEQDVLARCRMGLLSQDSSVTAHEAHWIVLRLAELCGWPLPHLDPPLI